MSQNGTHFSTVYGEPVGVVENTTGELSAVHKDGVRNGLRNGDPVFFGDLLETGTEAKARIKFVDGKTFNLGCDALMLLNDTSTSPTGSKDNPLLDPVCRIVDIVTAGFLLVFTLPLMLVAAVLVKTTSRGPVFARDEQTAKDGRKYSTLRFRCTLAQRINHSDLDAGLHKKTPVGAFIQATRVDELPRVFDVFRGNVTFFGQAPIRFFHS